MMVIYYDKDNSRLVYNGKKATEEFWDQQWEELMDEMLKKPPQNRYYTYITKKFLSAGSKILEGGCGMGDKVHAFDKSGFNAYGVDFAPKVVEKIKKNWPHLKVDCADVRKLPYEDNFFDGYWSFGVIEHFYNGFDDILNEMQRVIKKDGFLFLTFPMMNLIRKSKARRNCYPVYLKESVDLNCFYQFALDPISVKQKLNEHGFILECEGGLSSIACIGEEYKAARWLVNLINKLPYGIGTKISVVTDIFFGKYFGHSSLLVFRNGNDS